MNKKRRKGEKEKRRKEEKNSCAKTSSIIMKTFSLYNFFFSDYDTKINKLSLECHVMKKIKHF
jgi:hypothetical protein